METGGSCKGKEKREIVVWEKKGEGEKREKKEHHHAFVLNRADFKWVRKIALPFSSFF